MTTHHIPGATTMTENYSKSQQKRMAIQRGEATTMTEPMSEERLREIEAREQAATKGDWTNSCFLVVSPPNVGIYKGRAVCHTGCHDIHDPDEAEANAAFIAHARQDVPDLVAALRHFTTLPPEVAAAMENIKNKTHGYAEIYAVAVYFSKYHFSQERRDEVPTKDN